MNTGIISARYAKALLEFASDTKSEDAVYAETKMLAKNLAQNPEMRVALANPVLSDERKLALIMSAVEGEASKQFRRFIVFVLEQKRTAYLQTMALLYQDIYLKQRNIQSVSLVTSVELNEQTKTNIRKRVEEAIKGEVRLDTEVEPAIIGGFVASWDTYRLDASIKGQLQRVEKSLVKNNK